MQPKFEYPTYTYRAELVRIVDGDTIDVQLDVGFDTYIYKRLRFLGVDTWEMRGDESERGLLAKQRLEQLINGKTIYVQTHRDEEGKYGRVLAWIWVESDNGPLNVNQILLEEGHGTPM